MHDLRDSFVPLPETNPSGFSSPYQPKTTYIRGSYTGEIIGEKIMAEEKITEDMNIREVIEKYPQVVPVFAKYNMGCIGCIAASYETLKDIAVVHGTNVAAFVKDLNDAIKA